MVGWHHRLNGCEFEQTPAVDEIRGSLACCSPQGCKETDTTERLNGSNRADTERSPCEDGGRRRLSARKGGRPQKVHSADTLISNFWLQP